MRDFLTLYERLEELLLNKLPEYITQWNKENSDLFKFELKPFTNQCMNPGIEKFPYFALTFIEKEQGKKDRIIDTINYKFNFEFFYEKDNTPAYEKTICYQQIICQMLHEDDFEYWLNFEVPKLTQRKFELLVHVEW